MADLQYMKEALRLAAKANGHASPNPMVGAVVVKDGRIVGKGFHEAAGKPHAEVNALRDAGDAARGATLYVTLEPCNHFGRTPPCTRAVLEAGISRVVVGMSDPNPQVTGGGAQTLREHAIEVVEGVLERECRLLNQAFIKRITTGLPYVTLKSAATLDGRIATRSGDSKWITNEKSRRFAHILRCTLDAILVGIETVMNDDPTLTARIRRNPPCHQPLRIVLDSRLRIPTHSILARTAKDVPVWVACGSEAPVEKEAQLLDLGVHVVRLPGSHGGLGLQPLLQELGRNLVNSLLVEGGGRVLGSFISAGLADDFHFFYAPKILGDPSGIPMISGDSKARMADSPVVYDMKVKRFGDDVLLSGRFHKDLY